MGRKLEPLQVLFLWGLLAKGGEAWKGDLKPELHKNYAHLVKSGFVDEEQRKHPETKRARKWVRLSDAGWKWAQEHLDVEVSKGSKAGGQILQDFLTKLKSYLEHKNISLAEIICSDLGRSERQANLPERIRNAFLKETKGAWNTHVRLASLRRALSDIDRRELEDSPRNRSS